MPAAFAAFKISIMIRFIGAAALKFIFQITGNHLIYQHAGNQ
jgi:hypothetical protein